MESVHTFRQEWSAFGACETTVSDNHDKYLAGFSS